MSPLFFICLQLIARHRTRTLLLQQTLKILIALQNTKWKKVKKYKNKLGARKRRQPPSRPRWQPKRNQVDVIQVDIYARTGIFEDVFEWIYQKTKALIQQPRYTALYKGIRPITTALSPHARLLLILHWLRHYPRLTLLRDVYHVSTTYISREIKHILPILYTTVQSIQWPKKWVATGAFGAHGSVDCTAHYRWRVHPRQAEYYRGDKHAHFIAAQVCKHCFTVYIIFLLFYHFFTLYLYHTYRVSMYHSYIISRLLWIGLGALLTSILGWGTITIKEC